MMEFQLLSNLVMILKHLLKVHNLNDPYTGGISSYALTLMVVAFLQHQLILLKNGQYIFSDGSRIDDQDLAATLSQFLHFYAYQVGFSMYIIHPCNPGDLSHQPILYKFPTYTDPLVINDPLNTQNNVSKSSFKADDIKE